VAFLLSIGVAHPVFFFRDRRFSPLPPRLFLFDGESLLLARLFVRRMAPGGCFLSVFLRCFDLLFHGFPSSLEGGALPLSLGVFFFLFEVDSEIPCLFFFLFLRGVSGPGFLSSQGRTPPFFKSRLEGSLFLGALSDAEDDVFY